jgi:hypothetical protein
MRYASYIVGASLLLLSVDGCGQSSNTPQQAMNEELSRASAVINEAAPACRNGVSYLVYNRGPYTAITVEYDSRGYVKFC